MVSVLRNGDTTSKDTVIQNQRLWYGDKNEVALGSADTVYLTLPRSDVKNSML